MLQVPFVLGEVFFFCPKWLFNYCDVVFVNEISVGMVGTNSQTQTPNSNYPNPMYPITISVRNLRNPNLI